MRVGGWGWVRTSVGASQQIYSLPPLATRAPTRSRARRVFCIAYRKATPPRRNRQGDLAPLCKAPPVLSIKECGIEVYDWPQSLGCRAISLRERAAALPAERFGSPPHGRYPNPTRPTALSGAAILANCVSRERVSRGSMMSSMPKASAVRTGA